MCVCVTLGHWIHGNQEQRFRCLPLIWAHAVEAAQPQVLGYGLSHDIQTRLALQDPKWPALYEFGIKNLNMYIYISLYN